MKARKNVLLSVPTRLGLALLMAAVALGVVLVALAAPGDLDTTFGSDGMVNTDFGSGNDEEGLAIAVQSDGKIVVVGKAHDNGGGGSGSGYDFALARYHTNGDLDITFDSDGKVTTHFGQFDGAFAIAIQSDGKIVAAGKAQIAGDYNFALARYTITGTLDSSFGTGGLVTTDLGNRDEGYAMIVQPDGKIVVAGYSGTGSVNDFALARYNSDGTLDATFGTGGKVITHFPDSGSSEGHAAAIQSDGKIVVAGKAWYMSSGFDFALARYDVSPECSADFDGDGDVDIADIMQVARRWGASPGDGSGLYDAAYDLDGDGVIDVDDVQGAVDQWRLCGT